MSVLNLFSKQYETVIKMQIVSFLESQFFPYLGGYKESYNTQHVLIIDYWKNGEKTLTITFWGVFINLSKAFDWIPHDLLIAKLGAYGFK